MRVSTCIQFGQGRQRRDKCSEITHRYRRCEVCSKTSSIYSKREDCSQSEGDARVTEPSNSSWASPEVLVRKKDGP